MVHQGPPVEVVALFGWWSSLISLTSLFGDGLTMGLELPRLMDGEYFAETGAADPEPAIAAVTRGLRRGCVEYSIIVNLGVLFEF